MRALVASAIVLLTAAAHAETPEDRAAADALFEDARQLLAAGDLAGACAKFASSAKLSPRIGTRLNLADCHEQLGETATAWAEFDAVAVEAHKEGDSREVFARDRATVLEPKLSRLTIRALGHAGTITRDGVRVDPGMLGTAIPVNPGDHIVAAGTFRKEIHVDGPGTIEIEIPDQPIVIVPHPGRTQRIAGIAIGGAGALATIGSFVVGAIARSDYRSVVPGPDCDAHAACDDAGYQKVQSAFSEARASTILLVGGAAAIAAGAVVYFTARHHGVEPSVGIVPAPGGLVVVGSF